MKAVILAAGEGRRLRPLTNRRPKPMLPVANTPILESVVEAVAAAGIDEIVLVVGYQRARIQNHFGDGDDWGVDITYAIQERQLGTGHAVAQAAPYVDDDFLVLNGDRIIDANLVERVRTTNTDADAVVTATRVDTPREYGVVTTDAERLVDIQEKPTHQPTSELINAGVYRLPPAIIDVIDHTDPTPEGEIGLPRAVTNLADHTRVDVLRHQGTWTDVSQLWDLLRVNAHLLDDTTNATAGRIDPSAAVADAVTVGTDTVVGPNTTLRPGTALGPNVTVGANAVVANAIVLQDAVIEDGAVVRDCIVGENATVGAGSTVSGGQTTLTVDGTVHEDVTLGGVVGDNTTLGSTVVLEPGTVIGDDVTVGDGAVVGDRIASNAVVRTG
ncbi:NTP transferase domain-containing protein [Halostella sp. JP-L12]|uniref:bifunctional sugar-1-phosphate nucleotidylyltransferase/acetyltransferase n=1 Tax=Halostella TaxID=1843185 RepID=UPI000EF84909|nr:MULTISPECIES: bifunctional sugar-1-phosphate nucleotidylyltransferase/acetyltransferase [Halostella]NHN46469.1 NTP transferase domain-containing protein [Halostella sp. JP-L12]